MTTYSRDPMTPFQLTILEHVPFPSGDPTTPQVIATSASIRGDKRGPAMATGRALMVLEHRGMVELVDADAGTWRRTKRGDLAIRRLSKRHGAFRGELRALPEWSAEIPAPSLGELQAMGPGMRKRLVTWRERSTRSLDQGAISALVAWRNSR